MSHDETINACIIAALEARLEEAERELERLKKFESRSQAECAAVLAARLAEAENQERSA